MPAATESFPRQLFTAAQVRELDRIAIEQGGIPGIVLMKRAGRAAFELLQSRWPRSPITVFCGTGNNGGDGFIVAALAAQQHIPVRVWQVGEADKVSGDAALARDFAIEAGVIIDEHRSQSPESGVIVDGLLGTGFTGALREPFAAAIAAVNESGLPVLALDLPSGLNADTGFADNAVRAACSISFIGGKRGLFTGAGPDCAGDVYFDDLGVPPVPGEYPVAAVRRLTLANISRTGLAGLLPPRRVGAHKGHSGHVRVAGGDLSMGGAVLLAATAAARTGSGLTSCVTRPAHVAGILAARPEVMAHGIGDDAVDESVFAGATVVAVGPGLGRSAWGQGLLKAAFNTPLPLVIDADALNLLAEGVLSGNAKRDNWVLTPHPGEAARLLGITNTELNADRFAAVKLLQQRFGGVVVLKGAGTLIADASDTIYVADYAQPALASGGTGDVLTGIIAALIAQGLAVGDAARLGVCVHAEAAALAAVQGVRGTLAGDVVDQLRAVIN